MARDWTSAQLLKLKASLGVGRFDKAGKIFAQFATSADFPEFLTLIANDYNDWTRLALRGLLNL